MAILLLHSFLFTLETSNQKSISWLLLVQSNLYFVAWLTLIVTTRLSIVKYQ